MFQKGDRVMVTPRSAENRKFFEFVDGWRGVVAGLNNGFYQVDCLNPQGQAVTLFVPPDCLTITI